MSRKDLWPETRKVDSRRQYLRVASRVVECAQGALFGRILGAKWALRGRSSVQRPRSPGRFDGRSE